MYLVADDGNSLTKVVIFDKDRLIEKHTFSDLNELQHLAHERLPEVCLVASVRSRSELIVPLLHCDQVFVLTHELPVPFTNNYQTPQTLGVDRVAAVSGGIELFPKQNTLIIDVGTCVTYDFVDSGAVYHGGGIGPGLKMRADAVHEFTAKLPRVPIVQDAPLIGNSTVSCIQSGVINGMIEELNGIIGRYQESYDTLKVLMCGGDTPFFENKLKHSIFATPDLVLIGLNSILRYNVSS